MDDNSLAYTKWNCKCHIVFVSKYRRQVIYGKMNLNGKIKCRFQKVKNKKDS